jgi:hypothetical protein
MWIDLGHEFADQEGRETNENGIDEIDEFHCVFVLF